MNISLGQLIVETFNQIFINITDGGLILTESLTLCHCRE